MNKNMMVGIIVALLIGGFIGFAIERQRATGKMEATKMVMQKEIDDAKMMSDKQGSVPDDAMMKKDTDVMEMAMNDSSSKKATLADVSGGEGTGKAFVLRKEGKLYLTASGNLPDPANGTFYEGWLAQKGANPPKFIDTGKLSKQKDGSYEVSYSSDNLYEGYDFVVITWEQVDDQKPEKHILEGLAQ